MRDTVGDRSTVRTAAVFPSGPDIELRLLAGRRTFRPPSMRILSLNSPASWNGDCCDECTNRSREATKPSLPVLMTVDEAARLLRTTKRAIYVMVERRQIPGLTRIGRRVLFRSADLLHWLDQKRTPSPQRSDRR